MKIIIFLALICNFLAHTLTQACLTTWLPEVRNVGNSESCKAMCSRTCFCIDLLPVTGCTFHNKDKRFFRWILFGSFGRTLPAHEFPVKNDSSLPNADFGKQTNL